MNTLRALERLALEPQSTSELAEGLQIGIRTARRLLRRLELEGYVVQDGGHRRRFRATLRLAVLGRQLVAHALLPRLGSGCVGRLASETGCAAHLWIPAGENVLCVAHALPGAARPAPQPALRELVTAGDGAAGTVLAFGPVRSSAFVRGERGEAAAAAASVFERDSVVAALGVTGPCDVDVLPRLGRAAADLSFALERALRRAARPPSPEMSAHHEAPDDLF